MQQRPNESSPNGQSDDNEVLDDFSFVCLNPDGSPIRAEDAFLNGQIRPVFPLFDQRILSDDVNGTTSQLKNLFVEEFTEIPQTRASTTTAPAPVLGKKSYSTGFSKLWRFGDKIRRSSSEGKEEAFLFLRSASSGSGEKAEKKTKKKKKQQNETASYYHERHYARNRAENEVNKRKSYLPYRSNLMGFFTAPNGLNRNF
ncbi:uncharacterized protein LOC105435701 [Cucumis sativus]|uniref:Uncharacterized protein n=1 Tax=Cucumis sativus TaxID=3659 RepID=A0A0A0KQ75_CUCSA|nr:uncharacterized protein LOC105435701 [Cucumis sativus]KGN51805.1 hypothetical protein Csa_008044 [Cucumis sativus]